MELTGNAHAVYNMRGTVDDMCYIFESACASRIRLACIDQSAQRRPVRRPVTARPIGAMHCQHNRGLLGMAARALPQDMYISMMLLSDISGGALRLFPCD